MCVKSATSEQSFRNLLPLHHDGAELGDYFSWYRPCLVTSSLLVFVLPAIVSITEGQSRPKSTFDPQISGCMSEPCAVVWSMGTGDQRLIHAIVVEIRPGVVRLLWLTGLQLKYLRASLGRMCCVSKSMSEREERSAIEATPSLKWSPSASEQVELADSSEVRFEPR